LGFFGDQPGNTTVIKTQIIGSLVVHTVTFGGLFNEDSTYTLRYSIEVDPAELALHPGALITAVGAGIDKSLVGTGTWGLDKHVWTGGFGGTLVADFLGVQGSVPDQAIAGALKLYIEDVVTTDHATINSISNSFIETGVVPEPSSIILLGSGLMGLVASFRLRQRKS
jgi:hypothetical protein